MRLRDAERLREQVQEVLAADLPGPALEAARVHDPAARREMKPQAALVAINPKTGDVLAMFGGRSYAESQLNRATDARRQPGSTFKPFVYAAALEDGMSPVRPFMDAPREFVYDRNKLYRPANYGGGYSMQEVPMRTGLVKSLNVVTVDVALQTGLARIANLAERFGLPKPERYPSLALGTKEVTPLQLASAYGTFVNDGVHVRPLPVDLQMQQRLARPLLDPGKLLARHIDQANILRLQKAFAVQRRRAQDFVLADANGDIPIIRRREPLGINPPPDFANVLFELM